MLIAVRAVRPESGVWKDVLFSGILYHGNILLWGYVALIRDGTVFFPYGIYGTVSTKIPYRCTGQKYRTYGIYGIYGIYRKYRTYGIYRWYKNTVLNGIYRTYGI